MNDAYVNALNTQKGNKKLDGRRFREYGEHLHAGISRNKITFKTFLDSTYSDCYMKKTMQGKATPGTSDENVFLEGTGYFVVRNEEGKLAYTRLGEFKFDSDGTYKATDGSKVQGYIMNDKGEIVSGTKSLSQEDFDKSLAEGGALSIPTTEIKLWVDPDNGKYLGKYDEYEIKEDGILYGKANNGKDTTPLYKLSIMNFHNPEGLYEYKQGQFVETEASGKPVMGRGEIRSGLLELSNVDFKGNISYYQQAKMQLELSNKLISSYKELLQNVISLMS